MRAWRYDYPQNTKKNVRGTNRHDNIGPGNSFGFSSVIAICFTSQNQAFGPTTCHLKNKIRKFITTGTKQYKLFLFTSVHYFLNFNFKFKFKSISYFNLFNYLLFETGPLQMFESHTYGKPANKGDIQQLRGPNFIQFWPPPSFE